MNYLKNYLPIFVVIFNSFLWSCHLSSMSSNDIREEHIAFLIQLEALYPGLVSKFSQYNVDASDLLIEKQSLLKKLRKNNDFSVLESKRKLVEISLTPPEKGIAVGETVINLKAIEDWKKQKLSWLNEDENLSSIDQIKKFLMLEISKLSIHQDLSKLRPDNIIKKIGGKRKSLNSKLLERLQKEVFNENKELPVLFEKISNC